MVLTLDDLATVTRVRSDLAGPRPAQRLDRTLDRLGFGAGFATPRYAAPLPAWPSRRRDPVASEWRPL